MASPKYHAVNPLGTPINLFIALTPFHLLLSLILKARGPHDVVVLIDQTGSLSCYRQAEGLAEVFGSKVHYLRGRSERLRKLLSLNKPLSFLHSTEIAALCNCLSTSDWKTVYVFNDSSAEAQFILSSLRCEDVCYVEDGSAPYNDHHLPVTWIKRIMSRLLLGAYYDPCCVLGSSHYVKRSLFSFPTLVRPENAVRPLAQLVLAEDYPAKLQKFLSHMVDVHTLRSLATAGPCSLFILPLLSAGTTPSPRLAQFETEIRNRTAQGKCVLLKRHPLDAAKEFSISGEYVVIAPDHIPAELLFWAGLAIDEVVGDLSTSLLAIRFLLPEIKVVSLFPISTTAANRTVETFKEIGVYFSTSPQ